MAPALKVYESAAMQFICNVGCRLQVHVKETSDYTRNLSKIAFLVAVFRSGDVLNVEYPGIIQESEDDAAREGCATKIFKSMAVRSLTF